MRILAVSDAAWPQHVGGISKSLHAELKALAQRGHDVTLVARSLGVDCAGVDSAAGYTIRLYPGPQVGSTFYRTYPLWTLVYLPRVCEELDLGSFDVAYVHNPFSMYALYRLPNCPPITYVFHAGIVPEISIDAHRGKYAGRMGILLARLFAPLFRRIERVGIEASRTVIVRSQFSADMLKREHPGIQNPIALIPLGIDTAAFEFCPDPRAARRGLGIPEDRFVLLTVRRLVGRMGLENLIDAVAIVARQNPKVLLLIGGQGYLETALRRRVEERGLAEHVKLLGFIPEERLPRWYQAADLFVLPTLALEGFGLVSLEALSCGTPVVATPVGANPEVIGPLGPEFLTGDASAEAIAERIAFWMNRKVSTQMREECRKYAESRFNIHRVVDLLESILTGVALHRVPNVKDGSRIQQSR